MKKLLIGLLAIGSFSVYAQEKGEVYTVQSGERVVLLRSIDAGLYQKDALRDLKERCEEFSGTLLAKPRCETFHSGACYQICKF